MDREKRDNEVMVPITRLPEEFLEERGFNIAAAIAYISEQIYELHQELLQKRRQQDLELIDTILTDDVWKRHMDSNEDVGD